jgi:hypothetical protein
MAGLAAGLATGRREIVAAGAGAAIGVLLSLVMGSALGIIAGGLAGSALAMLLPAGGPGTSPDSEVTGRPVDIDEAMTEMEEPDALEAEGPR